MRPRKPCPRGPATGRPARAPDRRRAPAGQHRAGLGDTWAAGPGLSAIRPTRQYSEQHKKGTASWQGFGQGYA
ncbi:hypothetical protein CP967_04740 [Streptomyces nitrosporeus]|uniref:Uncharacterized protein n=1 Tax=Streptomyces nitrosporeus TaxID=28894 RepID=A0A5J6F519_9ACTN|nr:hypothetical protein CP967_04740 [Streptomyces nitrosporeus]